jgi:hypothetical protein
MKPLTKFNPTLRLRTWSLAANAIRAERGHVAYPRAYRPAPSN